MLFEIIALNEFNNNNKEPIFWINCFDFNIEIWDMNSYPMICEYDFDLYELIYIKS